MFRLFIYLLPLFAVLSAWPVNALINIPFSITNSSPEAKIWDTLTEASAEYVEEGDTYKAKVTIPPEVAALENKPIKIMGYMFPLEQTEKHTHFILTLLPPSCPFHPHAMTEQMVEVFLDKPMEFSYDPITIEGTLTFDRTAELGVIYFIRDGKSH